MDHELSEPALPQLGLLSVRQAVHPRSDGLEQSPLHQPSEDATYLSGIVVNVFQRLLQDHARKGKVGEEPEEVHAGAEAVVGSPRVAAGVFHGHFHVGQPQSDAVDVPGKVGGKVATIILE